MIEATYALALRGAAAALPLFSRGDGKLARGIRGRREATERFALWARDHRDPHRPLVLFHAPSAGEALQLRAVIEAFAADRPDAQLAFTHFSPSAERVAEKLPVDVADYLPIDLPGEMGRLLDALRPSAIVFSKTEVWPNLTRVAAERRIPIGLVNATLPEGSSRLRLPARLVLGPAHGRLSRVAAISGSDAERYGRLGVLPERLAVMGDSHFDRVWRKASTSTPPAEARDAMGGADGPILVAGSTWAADEDRLLAAVAALGLPLRVILVPHEPTDAHLARTERTCANHGLSNTRLSRPRPDTRPDVLLVDRVGILGDLYGLADIAYVGGGFGGAGLHSVLEPAAYGVPILFGPNHSNAREAAELIEAGGAFSVPDGGELREQLRKLLADPRGRKSAGSAARRFVEGGLGASARGAAAVQELLAQPS
jgi:3-deoxy-D-manno-octulosonic-acid transferase